MLSRSSWIYLSRSLLKLRSRGEGVAPRSLERMGDKTGAWVCRASRQRAFDRAGEPPPFKYGSEGVRVPRFRARFASNVVRVVRSTRASCADISDASSSSSQFAVQPIEPSFGRLALDERQPFNKGTPLDGLGFRRSLVSARRTVDGPSSLVFTSPRNRKDVRRSAHTRGRRVEAAGSPRLAAVCSNSWREAVK